MVSKLRKFIPILFGIMLAGCQSQSLEQADIGSQKQVEKIAVIKPHSSLPFDRSDSGRLDIVSFPYKAFGFTIGSSPQSNPKISFFKKSDLVFCGKKVAEKYTYEDINNEQVKIVDATVLNGHVIHLFAKLKNEDSIFGNETKINDVQERRHSAMITRDHGQPAHVQESRRQMGYFYGQYTDIENRPDLYFLWQKNTDTYRFMAFNREIYLPFEEIMDDCRNKLTAEALSGLMQKMGKFVVENQSTATQTNAPQSPPSNSASATDKSETKPRSSAVSTEGVKSIRENGNISSNPSYLITCASGRDKIVIRKENKWTDSLGASFSNSTWSLPLEAFAETICR